MSRTRSKQTTTSKIDTKIPPAGPLMAYAVTVLLFLVASFAPQSRLWGAAVWGYYSVGVRVALAALAAIVPAVWYFRLKQRSGEPAADSTDSYLLPAPLVVAGSALLFGILFYIFRAETHFLGDGYTALTNLARESPIVKGRGIGEGLVHLWVARFMGGFNEANALKSYQYVSIGAGLLFVAAAAWGALRLYAGWRDRVLFALGCLSGGYLMLYFGYVENYALFVLAVFLFGLTGLAVSRGEIPRWLLIVPAAFALFFHIFGVALLPATLYLLIAPTPLGKKIGRMSTGSRWSIALVIALMGLATLYFFFSKSFFFRFALLTPFATDFTIQGYTLLSPAHIVDTISLLFLLVPAFAIGVVLLLSRPVRGLFRLPEYRFLLLMALASLGLIFVLDPKLGMARDWDLFSFAAVPVVLLLMTIVLERRIMVPYRSALAIGAITLGFTVLGARVGIVNVPSKATRQIEDYIALDRVKGKHAVIYLIEYYKRTGDAAERSRWEREWISYPDERLVQTADSLIQQQQVLPALALLKQAVAANPMSHTAYRYIGSTNLRLGRCADAYDAVKIAEGLSPHDMQIKIGLGYALFCLGRRDEAEKAFLTAVDYAPANAEPYHALSQYYKQTGQPAKQRDYLLQAINKSDASLPVIVEAADLMLQEGNFAEAAELYERSLQRGLDTALVRDRIQRQPQLGPYFGQ